MEVLFTVLMFVPWIFVLWLANVAERRRVSEQPDAARGLITAAYVLTALGYLSFIGLGLLLSVAGLLAANAGDANAAALGAQTGFDPAALGKMGLGLWLPSLLGLILLLPPVRRLAARLIPINPASPVHGVALSYISLILANMLVTLGMGLRNMAEMLEQSAAAGSALNPIPGLWAQDITWAFMALVGVGWLARRGLGDALRRLAVVVPTLPQAALGLFGGLLLIPVVLALEYGLAQLGIAPSADVERVSEQLIGPLASSLPGILTLGLAAALGEETIFRGALQPRFGLLCTAALFALLHSTYGLTLSTALVFLVGLALGLVRQRANTTTTMITHAVYNMGLGLISFLGLLPNF